MELFKSVLSPCVENCLPNGENSTILWQNGNCTCSEEEYQEQSMAQARLKNEEKPCDFQLGKP